MASKIKQKKPCVVCQQLMPTLWKANDKYHHHNKKWEKTALEMFTG